MSPDSRAVRLLSKLYQSVLSHMRYVQHRMQNVFVGKNPLVGMAPATVEQLEPKLMLSAALELTSDMSYDVLEDNTLDFGSQLVGLVVTDTSDDEYDITLSATNGTLYAPLPGGGAESGSSITFGGDSLSAINSILDGLEFTPSQDFNGFTSISFDLVDDSQNHDTGGILVNVDAVNDTPVLTAPATITVTEDNTYPFIQCDSITIDDVESDAVAFGVNLVMPTIAGGLAYTLSGGVVDSYDESEGMQCYGLDGTLGAIKTVLGTLEYVPAANYNGEFSIDVDVMDFGSWPYFMGDSGEIELTVTAVNDAPVLTLPDTVEVAEDTAFVFDGTNSITISDVEPDTEEFQLVFVLPLNVGTLSYTQPAGLSAEITYPGEQELVFGGTLADIRTLLSSLVFTPAADYNGDFGLFVHITDIGSVAGQFHFASDTIAVTVTAGSPVLTLPDSININDGSEYYFPVLNYISDMASTQEVYIKLSIPQAAGILEHSETPVGAIDNNGYYVVNANGTVAAMNTYLTEMSYVPNGKYVGTFNMSIEVFVPDAPLLAVSGWVPVIVASTAAEHDLALDVSGTLDPSETTPFDTDFVGIEITDTFSSGTEPTYAITMAPMHGHIDWSGVDLTGDSVEYVDDENYVTFTGSKDYLNSVIAELGYEPDSNFTGMTSILITVENTNGASSESASAVLPVGAFIDRPPVFSEDLISIEVDRDALLELDPEQFVISNAFVFDLSSCSTDPDGDNISYELISYNGAIIPQEAISVGADGFVWSWREGLPLGYDLMEAETGFHTFEIRAKSRLGDSGPYLEDRMILQINLSGAASFPELQVDSPGVAYVGQQFTSEINYEYTFGDQLYWGISAVSVDGVALTSTEFGDQFEIEHPGTYTEFVTEYIHWPAQGVISPEFMGKEVEITLFADTAAAVAYTTFSFEIEKDPSVADPIIVSPAVYEYDPLDLDDDLNPIYASCEIDIEVCSQSEIWGYELYDVDSRIETVEIEYQQQGVTINSLFGTVTWYAESIYKTLDSIVTSVTTWPIDFTFGVRAISVSGGIAEQEITLTLNAPDENYSTIEGSVFWDRNRNMQQDGIPNSVASELIIYLIDTSRGNGPYNLPIKSLHNAYTTISSSRLSAYMLNSQLVGNGYGNDIDVAFVNFDSDYEVNDSRMYVAPNLGLTTRCGAMDIVEEALDRHVSRSQCDYSIALDNIDTFMEDSRISGQYDNVKVVFISNGNWIDPISWYANLTKQQALVAKHGLEFYKFKIKDPMMSADANHFLHFVPYATTGNVHRYLMPSFAPSEDESEPNLPGWNVYLDINSNGIFDSTEPSAMTDVNGQFSLSCVPEGDYELRVDLQTGWSQTTPQGFLPHFIEVDESETLTGYQFGVVWSDKPSSKTAYIEGDIYDDINRNSIMDSVVISEGVSNIIFMMDGSGSTGCYIDGTHPQLYADAGLSQPDMMTVFEAEKAGLEAIYQYLLETGRAANTRIWVYTFAYMGQHTPRIFGTNPGDPFICEVVEGVMASQDSYYPVGEDQAIGPNGIPDMLDFPTLLGPESQECYLEMLKKLQYFITRDEIPTDDLQTIFVSDGFPQEVLIRDQNNNIIGHDYSDIMNEVRVLRDMGVNLTAVGVGEHATATSLAYLDPDAKVWNPEDLGWALTSEDSVLDEPGISGITVFADLNDNSVLDAGEPYCVTDNGRFSLPLEFASDGTYDVHLRMTTMTGWEYVDPTVTSYDMQVTTKNSYTDIRIGLARQAENNIPNFMPLATADLSIAEDHLYSVDIEAFDIDGDEMVLKMAVAPDGALFNSDTGTVTWMPGHEDIGEHDFAIMASDSHGGVAQYDFTVTVTDNHAPVINSGVSPYSGTHNITDPATDYTYLVSCSDPDGDSITLSIVNPLDGMSIDQATRTLTWDANYLVHGFYQVQIMVSDPFGASSVADVMVSIVDPHAPYFVYSIAKSPGLLTGNIEAIDPDGGSVTVTAIELPQGATLVGQNLSWAPETGGVHNFSFMAEDSEGLITYLSFPMMVIPDLSGNQPPEVEDFSYTREIVAGNVFSLQLQAMDPEEDDIEWILNDAPAGLTVRDDGLVQWVPSINDLGVHEISISASDSAGGMCLVEFELEILASQPNPGFEVSKLVPVIKGDPEVPGVPYYCEQIQVTIDADDLTFSIVSLPTELDGKLTLSADGQLTMNKASADSLTAGLYCFDIRIEDGEGRTATCTFGLQVLDARPLELVATEEFYAVEGVPYRYEFEVIARGGYTLQDFEIAIPETSVIDGMSFYAVDANGDEVTDRSLQTVAGFVMVWDDPDPDYDGVRIPVTIYNEGIAGTTVIFGVHVEDNDIPAIVIPDNKIMIAAGIAGSIDMLSFVSEDFPWSCEMEIPSGAPFTMDTDTWVLSWTDAVTESYILTFTVTDSDGARSEQEFEVNASVDSASPQAVLKVSPAGALMPGTWVTVEVIATDDTAIADIELEVAGVAIDPEANGTYRFQIGSDSVSIDATVTDLAGNDGTASKTIDIIGSPLSAPLIMLPAGLAGSVIDTNPELNITIENHSTGDIDYTVVVYSRTDATSWNLTSGTTSQAITDIVCQLPDNLPNDEYILEVTANYEQGAETLSNTESLEFTKNVAEQDLELSFADLSLSGILPIEIARTYNSYDALNGKTGGMGYGWTINHGEVDLSLSGLDYSNSSGGAFTEQTQVTVEIPGEGSFTFHFTALAGDVDMRNAFTQMSGYMSATLEVCDRYGVAARNATLSLIGGVWVNLQDNMEDYNPADATNGGYYKITLGGEVSYLINASSALVKSVSDNDGNSLSYRRQGNTMFIVATTANSVNQVTINYDGQGRICGIIDPLGAEVVYGYDSSGDLVSVTDRCGFETTYEYENHQLISIEDDRGVSVLEAEYNAGRLESLTDLNGISTGVSSAISNGNSVEVVSGPDYIETLRDENGNVIRRIQLVDDRDNSDDTDNIYLISLYEYDDADRLLIERLPVVVDEIGGSASRYDSFEVGIKTRRQYDESGTLVAVEDALGNITRYVYDGDLLVQTINADGSSVTNVYNDDGQLVETTDASGLTTRYTYDDYGFQSAVYKVSDRGEEIMVSSQVNDCQGRVLEQTVVTEVTYNTAHERLDYEGTTTYYVYDSMGNQCIEYTDGTGIGPDHAEGTIAPSGHSEVLLNYMIYDAQGRVTSNYSYMIWLWDAQIEAVANIADFENIISGMRLKCDAPDGDDSEDWTDCYLKLDSTHTEYDCLGNVISQETRRYISEGAAADYVIDKAQYIYDRAGKCIQESRLSGSSITVASVEYPVWLVTRYSYDDQGRKIAETEPFMAYDGADSLAPETMTIIAGQSIRILHTVYDDQGRPVENHRIADLSIDLAADADYAGIWQAHFDVDYTSAAGWDSDQLLSSEYTGYDYQGNRIYEINASNARTDYYYDLSGRCIAVLSPAASADGYASPVRMLTKYAFDNLGRQVQITTNIAVTDLSDNHPDLDTVTMDSMNAKVTASFYNDNGQLERTVSPDSTVIRYDYDWMGNKVTETDGMGQATYYQYDYLGQLVSVALPAVDVDGDWMAREGQSLCLHPRYEYTYDANGNLRSVTEGLGQVNGYEEYSIIHDQNYSFYVNYKTVTTYSYDWRGQLKETIRDGAVIEGLETREDPETYIEYLVYDWTDADVFCLTSSSSYDIYGRETESVDFDGNVITYSYDDSPGAGGRLLEKSYGDPVAITLCYSYDAYGRVVEITEINHDVLALDADEVENDELVRVTIREYDDAGNLIRETNQERELHENGTEESRVDISLVGYEYDPATSQLIRTYTDDSASPITDTAYTYDSLGRLLTVSADVRNGDAVSEVTTYTYDLSGNTASVSVNTGSHTLLTEYTYDFMDRLVFMQETSTDNSTQVSEVLATYTYELDDNGRRIKAVETRGEGVNELETTIAWEYDSLGRLVEEDFDGFDASGTAFGYTDSYVYDILGNRIRYERSGSENFIVEYDIHGLSWVYEERRIENNQTTVTRYDYGDGTQLEEKSSLVYAGVITGLQYQEVHDYGDSYTSSEQYRYDLFGRLKSVLSDTGTDTAYTYSADGDRIGETVDIGDDDVIDEITEYVVDGNNHTGYSQILEQRVDSDGDGDIDSSRTYTIGHDVISQYDVAGVAAGVSGFLMTDGHGSTRLLVDGDGDIFTTGGVFVYDAFGNPLGFTLSSAGTTLLFSGEQSDQQTGLQYLRARYYNPGSGRFISWDPYSGDMEDPQSLHKYLYCHGDPINGFDPTGMFSLSGLSFSSAISSILGSLSAYAFSGYIWTATNMSLITSASYYSMLTFVASSFWVGAEREGYIPKINIVGNVTVANAIQVVSGSTFFLGLSIMNSIPNMDRGKLVKDVQMRLYNLRKQIPARSLSRITMAAGVAETKSGERIMVLGTSEPNGYLRKGVYLSGKDILVSGTGHAEQDIISFCKQRGWTLLTIGATRPVCNDCVDIISSTGAEIATPIKADMLGQAR